VKLEDRVREVVPLLVVLALLILFPPLVTAR
jgi:hypothetical protein